MANQPNDHEYEKWKYEQNRIMAERAHDAAREFASNSNDAAIASGNHTLRALIIINGGAAIAVLAFIGQIVSGNAELGEKLSDLTAPLSWFAWGVALATLSVGLSYLTNYCNASAATKHDMHYEPPYVRKTSSSDHWTKATVCFQIIAIIAAIISLVFFIFGMVEVSDAVNLLNTVPDASEHS